MKFKLNFMKKDWDVYSKYKYIYIYISEIKAKISESVLT